MLLSVRRMEESTDRVLEGYGRDGVDIPRTFIQMSPNGWTSAGSSVEQATETALKQQILETLQEHGEPMRATALKAAVKGRAQTIISQFNELVADGGVVVTYGEGKGRPKFYSVPNHASNSQGRERK